MSHHRRGTIRRKRLLKRRSLIASSTLTALLITAKLVAWLLGGSIAMLSSLLDSSLDAVSTVVTILSVRHAARPADVNHRFGHAKAEPMAAFAQAIFIAASGLFIVYESLHRFLEPQPVGYTLLGILVMGVSSIGLVALIAWQRHVVEVTGSLAIEAESLNYRGDLLLNLGVIVSLEVTRLTGLPWVDPLFGLGIALLLLRNSLVIGRRSLAVLMDEELDTDEREAIRSVALSHPQAFGVHDLRTRHTSECIVVEMHLELDGSMSLEKSHDIATEVEDLIEAKWPGAEVLIHQEPYGLDDHRRDVEIGLP